MNKLMIVGASILQLPAIKKAKGMGLYVGVADYNPEAVGIPYADEYHNVSTIDEAGVYEGAKAFKADGIMTLATDMPIRSVAYACEKLGLAGISYETALKATDKGKMMRAFEVHNVARPWYYILNGPAELDQVIYSLTFPCISKPTDNSGSRGVVLIENAEQLRTAVLYSFNQSRKGGVIIEEYMQGPEVSVEVMVLNGVPYVLQVTDKVTTGAPHFVEMGHSQPSQLPLDTVSAIRDLAAKAVLAVGIQSGPAHVEIISDEQGPRMVELGARMGGDCITTQLVPLSTGVDMVKATIQISLGMRPDIEPKMEKGAAIRYFNVPRGQIKSINGADVSASIHGVREIAFTKNVGDHIGEVESSTDRMGFVVAQSDNAREAIQVCEKALHMIHINVA